MKNMVAAASLAFLTAACVGGEESRPVMCIVTKDGEGTVRRADLLSRSGTLLHYGTNFTHMAQNHWQGGVYNPNGERLDVLMTVDDKTCDTIENWGMTSTPIVKP